MNAKKIININEGWEILQKGIQKITSSLEYGSKPQFASDEYMMLYTTVYNMCCQHWQYDYAEQLYHNYRTVYVEYINSMVLPSIRMVKGELMLRELVKRWESHKVMIKWLSYFFDYLDRYFIPQKSLPTLNQVGITCFLDLVYRHVSPQVTDTFIFLIDQERKGKQIDRALLRNVTDLLVEMGMGNLDLYERDLEYPILEDSSLYYHRNASFWIHEHSSSMNNYMHKVEKCLRAERERASHYLYLTTESKLLQKVQRAMFDVCSNELLEGFFRALHAHLSST